MASEVYVCLNIECRYRSSRPSPFCPNCGHQNTFVTQNSMRWRGWIGGILFLAIGFFILLIAVFASFLVASQRTAQTLAAKDVGMLLLLYGIAVVFLLGGISVIAGGGRWFIRSIVAFARRGGSGRI